MLLYGCCKAGVFVTARTAYVITVGYESSKAKALIPKPLNRKPDGVLVLTFVGLGVFEFCSVLLVVVASGTLRLRFVVLLRVCCKSGAGVCKALFL